jgi:adenylate cyclase
MQHHQEKGHNMAREIERKFLIRNTDWQQHAEKRVSVRQAFLSAVPERTVRVRTTGETAFLTVKGKATGASRPEFEYPIPPADADELLGMCEGVVIEKTRHYVRNGTHLWEIDVFHGANEGLIVAEIELGATDESFELPDWAGAEVTGDFRYQNASLATHPYKSWSSKEREVPLTEQA